MIDVEELKRHVDIEQIALDLYDLSFDERGLGRCYFHQTIWFRMPYHLHTQCNVHCCLNNRI